MPPIRWLWPKGDGSRRWQSTIWSLAASAPHTLRMAAILPTRHRRHGLFLLDGHQLYRRGALEPKGVSKDIDMLIGNGFCADHADETLALLRDEAPPREIFIRRYHRPAT